MPPKKASRMPHLWHVWFLNVRQFQGCICLEFVNWVTSDYYQWLLGFQIGFVKMAVLEEGTA